MRFAYPALPFQPRVVDPLWEPEYAWARAAGLDVLLVDLDSEKVWPASVGHAPVVYRGWMLTAAEYDTLGRLLPLAVSRADYLASHEATGWYAALGPLTFPSRFTLAAEVPDFSGERRYFVKGLVKSFGADSAVASAAEWAALLSRHELGPDTPLFVRDFVALKPDSERRFFVVDGQAYGAARATLPNQLQAALVRLAPRRFYALDVAETLSGEFCVVEVGEGQVSDLKEWAVPEFGEVVLRALASSAGL